MRAKEAALSSWEQARARALWLALAARSACAAGMEASLRPACRALICLCGCASIACMGRGMWGMALHAPGMFALAGQPTESPIYLSNLLWIVGGGVAGGLLIQVLSVGFKAALPAARGAALRSGEALRGQAAAVEALRERGELLAEVQRPKPSPRSGRRL